MARRVRKFSRRTMLLGAILLLAVILAGFGLARSNKKPASVTIPSTTALNTENKNSDKAGKNAIPSSSSEGASNTAKTNASNQSTLTLIAPWGNFVSNHSPGKNGSPTSEVSDCNTTPGATCYIKFTKGSLSRNLESKTADSNGATSWNWDVSSADLSSGKWQITATATLNGQSKSTSDQLPLEVQ